LNIAWKIGNSIYEAIALANIGEARIKLQQYSEALESLQTALKILREVSFPYAEASLLKTLAELHQELGDLDLALDYCNQALAIATELGIPLAQECQELKEKLLSEQA